MKPIKAFPVFVSAGLLNDITIAEEPGLNKPLTIATDGRIAKAWTLACVVDIDAAVMIAEQHGDGNISAEQTVTAMLYMASVADYMNTYAQPCS